MRRPAEGGERTEPMQRDEGGLRLVTHKIRIEVMDGADRDRVVELGGPEARVGSGRGCELVLQDRTVSRVHVVVRVEGDQIRVLDEGSRNGTLLDGVRIRDAYARPDSRIVIGATTLRLRMLNEIVSIPISSRERFGRLVGRSVPMRRLFALLERIAPTDNTVLVEGETGTGKELVAEAIHEESRRNEGPFVVFDCSAVSSTLIESELFGHVRGAFTGAVSDRMGAFELADGGTLFLDEVGELPLDLQPKLLRALERREVRRVGSSVPKHVDVRIVAATNRSLEREVESGRFREDLYYRLAVVPVLLPPLRERLEDVPLLVDLFSEQLGAQPGGVPEGIVRAMARQAWSGNVRELRNAVARALSLGTHGHVGLDDDAAGGGFRIDLSVPLYVAREAFERAYVEQALQSTGGNVSRAAEVAGVNRKFVQRAMKRFQLRSPRSAEDAEPCDDPPHPGDEETDG
jgi:transcriptional regulator with GAF, ATPase, and Fis domain